MRMVSRISLLMTTPKICQPSPLDLLGPGVSLSEESDLTKHGRYAISISIYIYILNLLTASMTDLVRVSVMLPPTLILLCSVLAAVEVGDSVEANLGAECSLRMVEDLPDLSTALSIVRLLCP